MQCVQRSNQAQQMQAPLLNETVPMEHSETNDLPTEATGTQQVLMESPRERRAPGGDQQQV